MDALPGVQKTLVPLERVASHLVHILSPLVAVFIHADLFFPVLLYLLQEPITGSIVIEEPGMVILSFDNYYSWITNKALAYSVSLTRPEEDNSERARLFVSSFSDRCFIF